MDLAGEPSGECGDSAQQSSARNEGCYVDMLPAPTPKELTAHTPSLQELLKAWPPGEVSRVPVSVGHDFPGGTQNVKATSSNVFPSLFSVWVAVPKEFFPSPKL